MTAFDPAAYVPLTHEEATARARLLTVRGYDVEVDLATGDETFESICTITFDAALDGSAGEGAQSFLDIKAVAIHEATCNGRPVDLAAAATGRLLLTDLLAKDNVVTVRATMAYSHDGQGLHRTVDVEDGNAYVYGHTFLDAAPRVFACFDQPDLKAPYRVKVIAPQEWTVLGNGHAERLTAGRTGDVRLPGADRAGVTAWRLAQTLPLATYFVTICAGPYASVADEHDGIPLGVHVRASQGERLREQAEEILTVTKQSFDHYHALFGIRYPFGDYHQVFVPEFNAGAMENPGCVTFRDSMIFRGAATDQERLTRAGTIAHEMAHMWFGDLVTMRWWDDLWLNESFAEYMTNRTLAAATRFTNALTDFTVARKTWGYAAERSPSTHPVAGNPPKDGPAALMNFDGISYAKGASVLHQFTAYLGDEAFIAGLRDYLTTHAQGNATLADFLAAMGRASGKDVVRWAQVWLRTSGLDILDVTLTVSQEGADQRGGEAGTVTAAVARRSPGPAPEGEPAADRPHAFGVDGYTDGELVARTHVVIDGPEQEVPDFGCPEPALVIPNADSLTWATVRLSERSLRELPTQLPQVPDSLARAIVWNAVIDGLVDAVLDPRAVLAVVEAAWPRERDTSLQGSINAGVIPRLLTRYLPPAEQEDAQRRVCVAATALRDVHAPGDSAYLVATRRLATSSDDEAWLRRVAGGAGLPDELAEDKDLRWLAVRNLAGRGLVDAAYVDAARAADDTLSGTQSWYAARAALPGAEDKAWAWERIVGGKGLSNHELNSVAGSFWFSGEEDLLRDYVSRYVEQIPALAGAIGEDALARVALYAFPATLPEQATVSAVETALHRDDLSAGVRRAMVDELAALRQVIASRAAFPVS